MPKRATKSSPAAAPKKGGRGSRKGGAYERELAKALSLWWTKGETDDAFWRSSQSGGRATQRAKSGKSTANACGDLRAETAAGQKLLDYFTIEIKRGYGAITLNDFFDGCKKGIHEFVAQASAAASLAGTPYWLLIHKRDKRDAIVVTNWIWYNQSAELNYDGNTYAVMPLSALLSDACRNEIERRLAK